MSATVASSVPFSGLEDDGPEGAECEPFDGGCVPGLVTAAAAGLLNSPAHDFGGAGLLGAATTVDVGEEVTAEVATGAPGAEAESFAIEGDG